MYFIFWFYILHPIIYILYSIFYILYFIALSSSYSTELLTNWLRLSSRMPRWKYFLLYPHYQLQLFINHINTCCINIICPLLHDSEPRCPIWTLSSSTPSLLYAYHFAFSTQPLRSQDQLVTCSLKINLDWKQLWVITVWLLNFSFWSCEQKAGISLQKRVSTAFLSAFSAPYYPNIWLTSKTRTLQCRLLMHFLQRLHSNATATTVFRRLRR